MLQIKLKVADSVKQLSSDNCFCKLQIVEKVVKLGAHYFINVCRLHWACTFLWCYPLVVTEQEASFTIVLHIY
jgi:hypothetical protein